MNESNFNSLPVKEPAASPSVISAKLMSWPRNSRTSCDSCKQMKIKCQRTDTGPCVRCAARNLPCTTPVERKKRKVTNKSDTVSDDMEARIKRLESAIVVSGQQETESRNRKEEEQEQDSFDRIESQADLSNHLSNLVVDADGAPNFIGWASGFSLFSPRGFRWISAKVGDKDELAQLISKASKPDTSAWGRADADLWFPTSRSQHTPLPPKDVALEYANCYFRTFNTVLPVVSHQMFNSYFERQYSKYPPTSTAWYALFNSVLSLGSMRTQSNQEKHDSRAYLIDYTAKSKEPGVDYFRNASSCFHELFFNEANLMAMQAITLMLFIATSSSNPQPAYVLTSAAGNLANTLGLHRNVDAAGRPAEETEQRRNVFWVFYILEKSLSQTLGRPSIINDNDVAVNIPLKKTELVPSPTGDQSFDIFQDQAKLAIIGSRIYRELYSASSQTKAEKDRINVVGKLDKHLQHWRDAIPIDIRPEHPIKCSDEQYASVVMMHFVYLDAVIMLHRLSGRHDSLHDDEVVETNSQERQEYSNPRVYSSHSLCLAAARRSVRLLNTLNSNTLQDQHIMWKALYYPMSAGLFLFTNILSNLHDQQAASDLQLMNMISSCIFRFVRPETSFAATPTVTVFQELVNVATRFLARIPSRPTQKSKRAFDPDMPILTPSAPHDSPYGTQTGRLAHSTTSDESTLEVTDKSPLAFAPFINHEPSHFDYNPTFSEPFYSSTGSEWDVGNLWMSNSTAYAWELADMLDIPIDPSVDAGQGLLD